VPEPERHLDQVLADLKASIDAREAKEAQLAPAPQPPPSNNVVQLPLWPEPVRGAPNSFLRSALFAAIQGKTRKWMKSELLACIKGGSVRFTGQQLDQSDLDVWEQAIHWARQNPLGNVCQFRGSTLLRAISRSTGKNDYEWLHSAITRLVACAVEVRRGPVVFTGSLLTKCKRNEATGLYELTLDPEMVRLYRSTDWTAIQWEQRQALKGKPLALWLHGYYSSHADPYPIGIDKLHQLSGSGTKNLRHFKANLKAAFADLRAATGIKGTIEGNIVTVEREPSAAQARHIARKRTGRRHKDQT
jgi:hypothetical protein